MKSILGLLAGLSILLISQHALAGDPERGEELASQVCASCHGNDGNLVLADTYPRLAGQHADYLVFALKAYRSGDRQNAIMAPFAQNLSDQDIEDLAAWFARQDGLVDLSID